MAIVVCFVVLRLAGGFPGFAFAAFLQGLQAFFTPLGAICGAANQFAAHQFQLANFRPITLAKADADDAGVAAVALAEAGPQLVEKLLDALGSQQSWLPDGESARCLPWPR